MPTASEVFREFNVDGDASSGQYQPEKEQVIAWGQGLEGQLSVLSSSGATQDSAIAALQATVAGLEQSILDGIWPVGSLYFTSNPTMPAKLAQGRTWVAYAQGRAIVGVGSADGVSYAGGQQRGAATHRLTTAEMPQHRHVVDPPAYSTSTDFDGAASISIRESAGGNETNDPAGKGYAGADTTARYSTANNLGVPSHQHTFSVNIPPFNSDYEGATATHNNIQPSIGVYVFRRTA